MTTIQLLATISMATLAPVAYLLIGVAAWQIADRRQYERDKIYLVYAWPAVLLVSVLVLSIVYPVIYDETRGGEP